MKVTQVLKQVGFKNKLKKNTTAFWSKKAFYEVWTFGINFTYIIYNHISQNADTH